MGDHVLQEVADGAGQVICYRCPVCSEEFQIAEQARGQEHIRGHAMRLDEGA